MVGGLLAKGLYAPEALACTCGSDPTGRELAQRTGITYFAEAQAMLAETDALVLACKPQQLDALDTSYTAHTTGKLIVSILAGTTLERLQARFPKARNLVRAMPNTPGQVGAGITAFAPLHPLEPEDRAIVEGLLGALGEALELPEAQLDAVTAISGSGPAYVFEFTAALREAAVGLDLAPDVADRLARQTVIGAARLLEAAGTDPEELRNAVTSKGGTTEAALQSMTQAELRKLLAEATRAAHRRSLELAQA